MSRLHWDRVSKKTRDRGKSLMVSSQGEDIGSRLMSLAAEEQTSQLHHPIIIFSADMKKRQSKIGQQLNQIVTEIP